MGLFGLTSVKLGLRELFYASICIILGYLLRVRDSYSLNPVWRKRSEITKFANGKFMTDEDRCPTPIITDLEGDSINEVVLISNDLQHLNILAMPSDNPDGDRTLAHVIVKNKAEMSFEPRIAGHRPKPMVVQVGFTVPYLSMVQIRKQIIIVVTDDWQVACFDSDLQLLWRQNLHLPSVDLGLLEVKSLAVTVSPFSIEQKHKGLVLIAGNFRHRVRKPDLFADLKEREAMSRQNRTIEAHAEEENETLTQLSTFALSAEDGSVLWVQDFGQSEADQNSQAAKRLSDIHWKLGLPHKTGRNKGESPWSDYGAQLDTFLPHMWADNSDSEVMLARVHREFSSSSSVNNDRTERRYDNSPTAPPAPALPPHHLIGFSYGGHRPHSHHEHVKNPNSVVVRAPDGLHVLSLVTGESRSRLTFPADRSLRVDLDKDGNLEKLVWDVGRHYTPCFLDIWRVKPVQEKIDQVPLCTSKRLFWTRSWSMEEDIYKKIPPRLIKSIARKSGVLRHFLGHNLFEDNTYDIITFGGLGRVTSTGLDGTIHWQTLTEAKWSDMSMNIRRAGGRPIPDEVKEEFLLSFQPSMVVIPLEESGPKVAAAVSGWNMLSVVDLVEGTLLAQHSLPAPSVGHLVYGDFDNDGLMDIIVTCKKGYIGFALKLQHNYEYTVLYIAIVFLIIILFSSVVSMSVQKDDDSDKDNDEMDNTLEDEAMVVHGDENIRKLHRNID